MEVFPFHHYLILVTGFMFESIKVNFCQPPLKHHPCSYFSYNRCTPKSRDFLSRRYAILLLHSRTIRILDWLILAYFSYTLREIWKFRNVFVFSSNKPNPGVTIRDSEGFLYVTPCDVFLIITPFFPHVHVETL